MFVLKLSLNSSSQGLYSQMKTQKSELDVLTIFKDLHENY